MAKDIKQGKELDGGGDGSIVAVQVTEMVAAVGVMMEVMRIIVVVVVVVVVILMIIMNTELVVMI